MVKPQIDDLMEAVESDDNLGFCIECGEEAFGVEPDARRYKCECCGKYSVYGAEELLVAGLYEGSED